MLVLTRKMQQQIQIGDNITITIVRVKGQAVRVGIDAPKQVHVVRGELTDRKLAATAEVQSSSIGEAEVAPAASPRSCEPSRPSCTAAENADCPLGELSAPLASKMQRRRTPGASMTSMTRRPQRLGPASLRGIARMR